MEQWISERDPAGRGFWFRNVETGLLYGHVRYPDGQPPTPYGCRWCGDERHHHGRQYLRGRGGHGWEPPTDAQILARMRARRRARGCRCHLPFVDPYRCEADECAAHDFMAAGGPLMAAFGWPQTPPDTSVLRERLTARKGGVS